MNDRTALGCGVLLILLAEIGILVALSYHLRLGE